MEREEETEGSSSFRGHFLILFIMIFIVPTVKKNLEGLGHGHESKLRKEQAPHFRPEYAEGIPGLSNRAGFQTQIRRDTSQTLIEGK